MRFSSRWCLLLLLLGPAGLDAQVITTVAGADFIFPSSPLPALEAPLGTLSSTSVDRAGNVYTIDRDSCIAVRISPERIATVIAGNGLCVLSGERGAAVDAGLLYPLYGALDASGNYYVREYGRIRKIDEDGAIHTVAGSGVYTANLPTGDGGPALSATITSFGSFVLSASGEIFIAEPLAHRIRKVDRAGIITTVAGTGTPGFSGDGGPAAAAQINNPAALALDNSGTLYFGDLGNGRIRKMTPDGIVSTVATAAADSLGFDASGRLLYSGPAAPQILRLNASGPPTLIAGSTAVGFAGDGGPALAAQFRLSLSFAADAQSLFIADSLNFRVRKVDAGGVVSTVAGTGDARFVGDGSAPLSTPLFNPVGLAVDANGSLYIGESSGNRVRKLSAGVITTIAGTGFANSRGTNGDGGPATQAVLQTPLDVAFDSAGNLYVAERNTTSLRKVAPDGSISSVPRPAVPWGPYGVASDRQGILYITDESRDSVYRYDGKGTPQRIAGTGARGNSGDGGPALSATFNGPSGIAVDAGGNIFVADRGNGRIRKIDANGNISTFAAAPNLVYPLGLTFDTNGNLYVADVFYIRKIAPDGTVTTVAGSAAGAQSPTPVSAGDGKLATQALIANAQDVALDAAGNVYFTEGRPNGRVRAILAKPPSFSVGPQTMGFRAASAGAPTTAQNLTLAASITGIEFDLSVDTRGTGNWLSVTPTSGATPRLV
ncbi:MAG: NHL repeat-containing protein, partial [Acidobacteriota bacterium]